MWTISRTRSSSLRREPWTPRPAALGPEGVRGDRLQIVVLRHRDDHLLVVDEVLDVEVAGIVGEAGATGVGKTGADVGELAGDHAPETYRVAEDRLELGDRLAELAHLLVELGAPETCQPAESHVEDVVRLLLAEAERLGHEGRPGGRAVVGGPDHRDHLVEHVEGLQQPLDDVRPLLRLPQAVLGAARDHLDLVVDVVLDCLGEVQQARDAVDERQHVDAEARLQRCVLVEIVEHDIGVRVALDGDDDPRRVAGGEVLSGVDAGEVARLHGLAHPLQDDLGRGLVRDLGDDDLALAVPRLLDLGNRPHLHRASPGPVGVEDARPAEDESAGREVGALHEAHQLVRSGIAILEHVQDGVDHLAEVVRRDVRRHADGDALRPVDQQVGETCRQHDRLGRCAVVVRHRVDGLLVDAGEHLHRERGETALRVSGGRWPHGRAGGAEVAVALDERVPEAEFLHHPGEGVVDRQVAVRVEGLHDLPDDRRALHEGPVGPEVLLVHGIEDPSMDRLQPVPHVREGPLDDDRHGVLEERALHLHLDLDRHHSDRRAATPTSV